MATIRLVPATYELSSTQYLSVSNASNMYTNTDSDTYATITNTQTGTTSYYIYVRGFNFNDIPANVTINSFSIKIKARESGISTNANYSPKLCNDTNQLTSTCNAIGTTASVYTFSGYDLDFDELKNYGDNFGIRINCRRNNRNTTGYMYIYGAEIEIDYTPNITYNIISTNNSDNIDSISPEGLTEVEENGSYTLNIYGDSIDNIKILDNEIDVTSSLVEVEITNTGDTINAVPLSNYDTEFSASGAAFYASGSNPGPANAITAIGYTAESPNPDTPTGTGVGNYVYVKDSSGNGTATGSIVFNFDFSSIPQNAIIDSVSVKAYGCQEQDSSNSDTDVCKIGVYSGNILKGTEENITRTSNGITTMSNVGTWTRDELQNAKLKFTVGYYGGRLGGITWSVSYSMPTDNPYYWTYTLSNVQADHTIVINNSIIEIPEEDPQYNYYPITISSINATTDPGKGTTRVIEGTNQTITIYPSESQITLVTDNGVDVSSQLVAHGGTISDPIITTKTGADEGFTLNSSTGYYVSDNAGQSKTAAVCRVTFNLPVRCLITIQFINYAEATYDFGVFGNIDVPLSTNYYPAGSNGATISETSYKLACNTSTYNTSTPQTLTYEIDSGEHFIEIKYSKDDASDDNNDTLQWKILSIEPLESNNYYTYTLSNIQEEHSLIFIFGDVTYYLVNSSGTNCKLFPNGSLVQLPGDNYSLTIVPDNYNYAVTLKDNNVLVTPTRKEEEITKDGNTYTVVNYVYTLTNIQATHNLVVTCTSSIVYYIKLNGTWEAATDVLLKQDNRWGTLTNIENIFRDNLIFYKNI